MKVNPCDGKCRSCGGELDIIEADDSVMTVACASCSDTYDVETDAFGDGCMTYLPGFMMEQMEGGDGS